VVTDAEITEATTEGSSETVETEEVPNVETPAEEETPSEE
jgi:hypothetical protein